MKRAVNHLGWEYIFDNESEPKYQVLPPEDERVDCPEVLYKIYGITKNSVNGLEKGELFASHPAKFNDPFDSHMQLLNIENAIDLKSLDEQIPKEDLEGKDEMGKMLTRQQFLQEQVFLNTGIICLSANPNHIPMWSYYGQNHEGFMIGFEPEKLGIPGSGPFPMNYQEKFGPIPVSEIGYDLAVLIQINLKNIDWIHESEWRLFAMSEEPMETTHFPSGKIRTFNYHRSAVNMVALGYNFFKPEEKEVHSNKMKVTLVRKDDGSLDDQQKLKEKVLRAIIANNYKAYNVFRNEHLLSHIAFAEVELKELADGVFELTRVESGVSS